jgi:hypothetical protein
MMTPSQVGVALAPGRLQALLRSEVAATNAYEQALAMPGNDGSAITMQVIHADHCEAAQALTCHVKIPDGETVQTTGLWNRFALRVAQRAHLTDNKAALAALKDAEEQTLRMYHDALLEDALPEDCATLIIGTLLPQARAHGVALERLLKE